ncbi:GNAT family N-acetyltransferase [Bacillus sp. HMF5848]|uniref:GNAT family N-acetyltransferase n=1 Tax=Bacillus sp. HMF5848 TaxID=2495421 RepID=UPI000F7B7F2F|nr:GNAT family N-acetyltransferase [Bacillus sp. HMF5848]RSK27672.1 GNAT family N-acetyltransferase [Bacillus sp. HMF5848]
MIVQSLNVNRINDFVVYCKKHRHEVDESYLYDEDLSNFQVNEENPTYIIVDEENNIVAAASLILDQYHKEGKRARFRIFHSELVITEYYQVLLNSILAHTEDLDKVFLFIPNDCLQIKKIFETLQFNVERYSFVLVRDDIDVPKYNLPNNYEIKPYRAGVDEEIWCDIRNASFATLKGNEVPISRDMVSKLVLSNDYIEGGMMILYHLNKPIGVVRGSADIYEGIPTMSIGPLAIIPSYQGKGLGRILLRAVLKFAREKSYSKAILCVNGENERAKTLYEHEGFKEVEAVVCYKYDIKTW